MTFRRLFAIAATVLLCIVQFGNFTQFASAEVVHAYRKPNETEVRWLLGGDPVPVPDDSAIAASDIVQVGYSTPSRSSSGMLMPHGNPCNPVSVPIPMPPPTPRTANNKMNDGLAPEPDGVVNITPVVIDSSAPVVQMTGERLPPPTVVPNEENIAASQVTYTAESLSVDNREHFSHSHNYSDHNYPSPCKPAVNFGGGHGSSHHCETRFCVPDMLGSSAWFTGYSVGSTTPTVSFALPTMLLTRPDVIERFNAEVQNRIWADYRHWNNAISINDKSRAVEQFSFGLEKQLLRRSSVELHVPVISQFASKQTTTVPATSVELGNVSVSLKQVFFRGSRLTISGGIGATLPTAEDWRLPNDSIRLKNNAYYLVSFLGAQWHPNDRTFGHFVVQTDMPIEKNELIVDTGSVMVSGQQVIRTGVQLGRWIYRVDDSKRSCRLGAFAEVDYAVVTDGSPQYDLSGVYVSALDSSKSTLTAAVGVPMVFGKLTCTNAVILPISGSNRPFSVCYSFALSRQF